VLNQLKAEQAVAQLLAKESPVEELM
jgi:hypothetical protein